MTTRSGWWSHSTARRPAHEYGMTEDEHIVPSGPLKDKKIVCAPTSGVDMFRSIAEEFMAEVFGLQPGDYLITDESSLADFTGLGTELDDIKTQVRETYDIDVSDLEYGTLVEVFMRIHSRRYGAPG